MSLSKFMLLACVLIPSFILQAQNRQGNIVEYFGKEKVEEVREGEVIHIFKEGLILRKQGLTFGSAAVLSDPLLASVLLSGESEITEGKQEQIDGQNLAWASLQVGDKNEFNDRGLRSGYLYLNYNSPEEKTVLLDASGHTSILINGFPHEGDHYDFGWQLIPIQLKKGKNELVLTGGRFPRMRARLLAAKNPVQFTTRDLTLPNLLIEETEDLWGAIRVMNTQDQLFSGGKIICQVGSAKATTPIASIAGKYIRKVPFQIPNPGGLAKDESLEAVLTLQNAKGKELHQERILLQAKSKHQKHKRTLISAIDGSVQYYSLAPSSNKNVENPALFLSVHGASVEAVNQANAYQQKDWGHVVAPTNRRPFGFAWEDWGRLDALEVLEDAEQLLGTDPQRTYLTGHSMGGHGTWYLGATYPDRFAAIAPCAGYPDLLAYRASFVKRMMSMPDEALQGFGMTREELNELAKGPSFPNLKVEAMDAMVRRGGMPSRTLQLKRNYLHYGIYVLHGEDDTVVPTFIAQEMREVLGKFHNDFTYYEYPDGTHWYGDHSMDWPPIFDFFKARSIKADSLVDEIEFSTASPGVSASSHFISILQQESPFNVSSFHFERHEDGIHIQTDNVTTLAINVEAMASKNKNLKIDGQDMDLGIDALCLRKSENGWQKTAQPSAKEKGPHRNGGFKDAFRHNVVLVYATSGSQEENQWYYQRALSDAEKFWYRANSNVELVADQDFKASNYADRNVILYGNKDNNSAWDALLSHCPIQVSNNEVQVSHKTLKGDQWGAYFIYPRPDSDFASVGVVTASGIKGMKGAYANDYLVNGTTFPDLLLFDHQMMSQGLLGVECSGFFGNDWSVEKGAFVWR